MEQDKFSGRLRHLRKDLLHLTLKAFAARAGTSQGYVHQLEAGRKENPSREFLQRICDKLEIRREWLENGTGEPFETSARVQEVNSDSFAAAIKASDWKKAFQLAVETIPVPDLLNLINRFLEDKSLPTEVVKGMAAVAQRRINEMQPRS